MTAVLALEPEGMPASPRRRGRSGAWSQPGLVRPEADRGARDRRSSTPARQAATVALLLAGTTGKARALARGAASCSVLARSWAVESLGSSVAAAMASQPPPAGEWHRARRADRPGVGRHRARRADRLGGERHCARWASRPGVGRHHVRQGGRPGEERRRARQGGRPGEERRRARQGGRPGEERRRARQGDRQGEERRRARQGDRQGVGRHRARPVDPLAAARIREQRGGRPTTTARAVGRETRSCKKCRRCRDRPAGCQRRLAEP
jgi:hypothetical protein